jgi:hypothetical protein
VVVLLALFYPTTMAFLCIYVALLPIILILRTVHLIITWVVHGFKRDPGVQEHQG